MTTRFAGHLLTGDHASRPAATTVPTGTLYSCTTHPLVYQSDGATWSTWASQGSSGFVPDPSGEADDRILVTASGALVYADQTGGSGGGLTPTASKTANYTAVSGDLVRSNAAGGAFTITLPTATAGAVVGVLKTDSTVANLVTVAGAGGATIGGYASRTLQNKNQVEVYVADGTNWHVESLGLESGKIGGTATAGLASATRGPGMPRTDEGHVWQYWTAAGTVPPMWAVDSTGAYVRGGGGGVALVDMGSNDMEAEFVYVTAGGGSADSGLTVRFLDPQNFYYVDVFGGNIRLIKVVAGSLSVVNGSVTSVATGNTVKLKIQGTTWTVYKNGVSAGTGTDTGLATGTYCGLKEGTANVGFRWKSFLATAL